MSHIVSLFAPPGGVAEAASGSSGKKPLKSPAMTGEETFSPEGIAAKKPLRKKKKSFMDHLLFHAENASLPAPVAAVSRPAKKEVTGKALQPQALSSDSGEPLKKSVPRSQFSAAPVLLPGGPMSGEGLKSDRPGTKALPASLPVSGKNPADFPSASPVSVHPSLKKTDSPVSGSGARNPAKTGEAETMDATTLASKSLSERSGPEIQPLQGKIVSTPENRSVSSRPPDPSSKTASATVALSARTPRNLSSDSSLEKMKGVLAEEGKKGSADKPRSSRPGDKSFEIRGTASTVDGAPDPEKASPRELSLPPDGKTIASSPFSGDSPSAGEGGGEKSVSRDLFPEPEKTAGSKDGQSKDASSVPAVLLAAPETFQKGASPSIDQREMVSKVVESAKHGGGEISLRVHPPALGPIRIQVHVDPRTREVEVRLSARDESIGDLLRSKSQELKGALSREGFTMHRFHVDGGSGDLPVSASSQSAFSGFSSGGDSSSGPSQGFSPGTGSFSSLGSGVGSHDFAQGGDASRERSPETFKDLQGPAVPDESSSGTGRILPAGDLSGFHRVV